LLRVPLMNRNSATSRFCGQSTYFSFLTRTLELRPL
jgi:hypothetical protein